MYEGRISGILEKGRTDRRTDHADWAWGWERTGRKVRKGERQNE